MISSGSLEMYCVKALGGGETSWSLPRYDSLSCGSSSSTAPSTSELAADRRSNDDLRRRPDALEGGTELVMGRLELILPSVACEAKLRGASSPVGELRHASNVCLISSKSSCQTGLLALNDAEKPLARDSRSSTSYPSCRLPCRGRGRRPCP